MKELVAPDAATVEALTARLKQAKTIAEFQRIQCVLMRATTVGTAVSHSMEAVIGAARLPSQNPESGVRRIAAARASDGS